MMKTLLTTLAISLLGSVAFAQISLSEASNTYTNDFNTYTGTSASLPTGITGSGASFRGANSSGTATSGGFYSYGDGSLGIQRSGSASGATYTMTFTNNGAGEITSFSVSYNFEQIRFNNTSGLAFSSTAGDVSGLDENGTGSGTNGSIASTPKSTMVSGIAIAAGSSFTISFSPVDASGSDNGLGVDDFQLIATFAAPLPVSLTSFEATPTTYGARLAWSTASELNNDFFGVEVSTNGVDFVEFGRVLGAGTTEEVQDYVYSYDGTIETISYFRLRQVDYDGTETYSNVEAVSGNGTSTFRVLGSAAVGGTVRVATAAGAQLTVVSLTGAVVEQFTATQSVEDLDVSALPAGIYLVSNGTETRRFVR